MIYKFCLLGMLGAFLFTGCYDDKGNYDYRLINEVTVEHEFFGDTILRMYAFVDTLRITPEIKGSIDGDIDNYEFEWVAAGDNFDKKGVYTIGLGKDLEYPITLPAQSYRIFYNV